MEEELFFKIIKIGIQAPSGDNTQPWIIKPDKKYESFTISVKKDEDDFFDIGNSAIMIDSGTFLKNIEIGCKLNNLNCEIKINNNSKSLEMGKVIFKKNKNECYCQISEDIIFKRATSRLPYKNERLPLEFQVATKKLNKKYTDIKISFFEKNKELEELLYFADILRMENFGAHKTLYKNLRYTKKEILTKEGLDVNTLGLPCFSSTIMRIMSKWELQKFMSITKFNRIPAYISTKKLLESSQGIGIIHINKYNKESIIKAGMLFEEFWLNLTKYGGYLQPFATIPFFLRRLNRYNGEGFNEEEIIKLKEISKKFYKITKINDQNDIVMVFRYGISEKPTYSLRLEPKDIIIKT